MPQRILGKTVFVLGAGASFHTRIPLMKDFLGRAERLRRTQEISEHGEDFDFVLSWIEGIKTSSISSLVNITNIEEAFSIAYLRKQLGLENSVRLYDALTAVLCETVERSGIYSAGVHRGRDGELRNGQVDGRYLNFMGTIQGEEVARKAELRTGFEESSVITFNWDVYPEVACDLLGMPYNYDLNEAGSGFKILKLHGSMNWITHRDCEKGTRIGALKTSELQFVQGPNSNEQRLRLYPSLRRSLCPNCKRGNAITPVIVPPVWNKSADFPEISRVWREATMQLGRAEQIVFCGYSFPETDSYFKYILVTALQKNPNLKRIVVVNTDGRVMERIRKLFSPNLAVISFNSGFAEFVGSMSQIFSED